MANQIDSLREIIDNKMENISKITKQISVLNERTAECSAGSQLADSRTAYALSLYAKISNITWDYKAAQGKLSGSNFFINHNHTCFEWISISSIYFFFVLNFNILHISFRERLP